MEGTESTTGERTTGPDGSQAAEQMVMGSSKPLYRFTRKEPRSLGIVILMFGCAEVLMGFHLSGDDLYTSSYIYIPFWQGALFLICGILSIYTEIHPSKKMVTVCLAMYVVSLLGIVVSVIYRIIALTGYSSYRYSQRWSEEEDRLHKVNLLIGVESILFTSSVCVSGLLIFLCVVSRLALKSTNSQFILQHFPPPQTDATSN